MPPKRQKPSKKTERKEKEKVIEDKTFGLKNKNKSKKVQKFIKSVAMQVHGQGKKSTAADPAEAGRLKKEQEKERKKELLKLFKTIPKDGEKEKDDKVLEKEMDELMMEDGLPTIEALIERERVKLASRTPVTEETFQKWREFRVSGREWPGLSSEFLKERARMAEEERKKLEMTTGSAGLEDRSSLVGKKDEIVGGTGRSLFATDASLFVDDDLACLADEYEIVEEDEEEEDDDDDEGEGEEGEMKDGEGEEGEMEEREMDTKYPPSYDAKTWTFDKLPKSILTEWIQKNKSLDQKIEFTRRPVDGGMFFASCKVHAFPDYPLFENDVCMPSLALFCFSFNFLIHVGMLSH
eukprot:TRINITY_DN1533_c2_g1_i2.p1 TRINITY_DN1533_c2_g1~~TRINITY_DN1533_c2_g1_i2.p1  ORF type:complete len:352 (-),score=151.89 TRINITY_DN1533_c2_g1_i2:15-1070(-)